MNDSPKCPVCDRPVEGRDSNDSFPFCSRRCRQVDLSRWFDEEYTIPMTPRTTERALREDDPGSEDED